MRVEMLELDTNNHNGNANFGDYLQGRKYW